MPIRGHRRSTRRPSHHAIPLSGSGAGESNQFRRCRAIGLSWWAPQSPRLTLHLDNGQPGPSPPEAVTGCRRRRRRRRPIVALKRLIGPSSIDLAFTEADRIHQSESNADAAHQCLIRSCASGLAFPHISSDDVPAKQRHAAARREDAPRGRPAFPWRRTPGVTSPGAAEGRPKSCGDPSPPPALVAGPLPPPSPPTRPGA